jgi:hypothetical protein
VVFGNLLSGCIRDVWVEQDRMAVVEGVMFLILGAASSVATTYLLSMAGIFV